MNNALMMEVVRISETSVNFNLITLCYIPEDSKLRTRRREISQENISSSSFSDHRLSQVLASIYPFDTSLVAKCIDMCCRR
jgi:hypothetical protein